MIADPPSDDGGLQARDTCDVPPIAVSDVGAAGAVGGGVVETAKTVPVICARVGLDELVNVTVTQAGGPAL